MRSPSSEESCLCDPPAATQVAVAYCLAQEIPVVPLIGPLTLQELDDSLGALEITLTPADVKWLEG